MIANLSSESTYQVASIGHYIVTDAHRKASNRGSDEEMTTRVVKKSQEDFGDEGKNRFPPDTEMQLEILRGSDEEMTTRVVKKSQEDFGDEGKNRFPPDTEMQLEILRKRLFNKTQDGSLIRVYNKGTLVKDMAFNYHSESVNQILIPVEPQKTCAVVGNGGILRDSRCGDEINSKEFVIRCNVPPVVKYALDVGYKTNVTVINPRIIRTLNITRSQKREELRFMNDSVLWYSSPYIRGFTADWLRDVVQEMKSTYNLRLRMAYTNNDIFVNILKSFVTATPSAGIRSVVAALSICDDVTVYGCYPFPADKKGNALRHHYYDKSVAKGNFTSSLHSWNDEFALLQSLHERGNVTLVTDRCL
uniref:CMP-N-acetylneuraminate-poly-alpha-2, 8-sialyltransferase-like n=1 Tax=Saccoglossus kowalevskii TaxID=10224 RepID=A0ABM0GJA3_SACKO|nr:PREDICTED: CMP-N-acetylneuraminate-poly-alpha-2,8-sialyltransferase-like [Saccoglossus kowalevskii]